MLDTAPGMVSVEHVGDLPPGVPAIWADERTADGRDYVHLYLSDQLTTAGAARILAMVAALGVTVGPLLVR